MANIDSQISKIRSAERGEDVRDSIISALRDINNDVPADMSNPEEITLNMPAGSDIDHPINTPKLVSRIHVYQPNSGGKSTVLIDAKIVENGKYPSEDKDDGGSSYDPDKEIRYYKSVDVNVPQLANKVIDLEEEITQNGTYSAPADWGADGLRTFTVNVNSTPVSGQFEVEFYESTTATTPRETQLVPAYGSAIPSFTPTPPVGQNFVGWNPSPNAVTKNMKCYPRFADTSVVVGEIGDSWEVICQKGGEGYPLGAFKSLSYHQIFTYDECVQYGVNYGNNRRAEIMFSDAIFYKVAEGESGSKSTWLSRPTTIQLRWSSYDSGDIWLGWSTLPYPGGYHQSFYWPDRLERKFFNMMVSKMDLHFQQHIAEVIKYTQTSTSRSVPYHVEPTNERLWIPSVKEIYIDGWDTKDEFADSISKDKYVTNVSGGLAYMNDVLALTPKQRQDALLLNETTTFFRDAGPIWDQSPIMNRGDTWEGDVCWRIVEAGRHDNGCIPSMLGFCLI